MSLFSVFALRRPSSYNEHVAHDHNPELNKDYIDIVLCISALSPVCGFISSSHKLGEFLERIESFYQPRTLIVKNCKKAIFAHKQA